MRRDYRIILIAILTALLCLCIAGCAGQQTEEKDNSLVYMNYGTGIQENGKYNDALYGMNGMRDITGADPGAFYVSEEESPEYGGYYYMYQTGTNYTANQVEKYKSAGIRQVALWCFRSKDLYNWEQAGYYDGYALGIKEDDWITADCWAPEPIYNPADGKFYLYFSAGLPADYGIDYLSNDTNSLNRLYLSVAVSDTPVGPFELICDTDEKTGKKIPTINFQLGCDLDYWVSAIDASPFFDDDGNLYLYFVEHTIGAGRQGVWGMKMKSMEYPDYSTVRYLLRMDTSWVSNETGTFSGIEFGGSVEWDEGYVNEAPVMIKHAGMYYLVYTRQGYTSTKYSVFQSVSDSPLGTFRKLSYEEGNPVCDGSELGWMAGTGHCDFVRSGDEIMLVCHRHSGTLGWNSAPSREIFVDRVKFVPNADGMDVLTTNGPSKALQWLPESISGYKNLAQTAEVTVSTGSGAEYLTDEIIPYYTVTKDRKFVSEEGDVTVTLRWKEPVSVSSFMLYNSVGPETGFSKVSDLRFKLAEQPEWASKEYDYAVIKDLEFPSIYLGGENSDYIGGAPAVAEFDSIKVTEIQFTILQQDRLVENAALNLSEIVVLGKE
ncbi:MAG: family 43 glycosylhydrolase [Tyzzerella sp.]|nr:family 43 glycosylhydrolase [Tyzzerella sp.]